MILNTFQFTAFAKYARKGDWIHWRRAKVQYIIFGQCIFGFVASKY